MVTIDPPEQGRCWARSEPKRACRHYEAGCNIGYGWLAGVRPQTCIAAEAEVAALQGGIIDRVQEIADGLWPHGTEKRDRVADALAALQGGE